MKRTLSFLLLLALFASLFINGTFASTKTGSYKIVDVTDGIYMFTLSLNSDGSVEERNDYETRYGTYEYYDLGIVVCTIYEPAFDVYEVNEYYLNDSLQTGYWWKTGEEYFKTDSNTQLVTCFNDSSYCYYNTTTDEYYNNGTFIYLDNKTIQLDNGTKYVLSMDNFPDVGTATVAGSTSNNADSLNGWQKQNGSWYYYTDNAKATGWKQINGAWYYFNNTGIMQTGWLKSGGRWYYLQSSGAMATGWVKVNGSWYYMNTSGQMQTGWFKVNGSWYYLQSSGAMKTGWLKSGGCWYYLQSSGAMATGWVKVNGSWYYMNTSGQMQTGWVKVNGSWYYLQSSGAMKTGWLKSGSYWYYLQSSGAMACATTLYIGGTYNSFDASGHWLTATNSDIIAA